MPSTLTNPTSFAGSVAEAAACLLLGIRAAFTPRALLSSALIWLMAIASVGVLFYVFHDVLQQLATSLVALAVMGLVLLFPGLGAGTSGVVGGGWGAAAGVVAILAGSWLLMAVLAGLTVIVMARVFSELLLMSWVQKQALRSHGGAVAGARGGAGAGRGSVWREWRGTWVLLLASPLLLVVPLLGVLLFAMLLAYLNARFLLNDALSGLDVPVAPADLARALRLELLAIGLMSSLLSLVPLLGLLSPWATGAAVCHLTFRHLGRQADQA